MQRQFRLLAAAILASTPTEAFDVTFRRAAKQANPFGDDIEYVRYETENNFTFSDPNYDQYEKKLTIFERGLAIYLSKLIQDFALKYHEDFAEAADEQLGLMTEYIYDSNQLLMIGIQGTQDLVNTHVLAAIQTANSARQEAEENMLAGLEVANFRAKEIQQEYEASFSTKKREAIKKLQKLQAELNKQNVKEVQDYLIEQIEQILTTAQDELAAEAEVFEQSIRLPMEILIEELHDASLLYDTKVGEADSQLIEVIEPQQDSLEKTYEQIKTDFEEVWYARVGIVYEALMKKSQNIEKERDNIEARIGSLKNDIVTTQLQKTLAESYTIIKQNCDTLQ